MRLSISMSKIIVPTLGLLLFVISPVQSLDHPQENGLPYIRNFTPKEYSAHSQNWAIIQDQRGIIYVGNTEGLLEYDGVSWRLIKPSGKASIVLSLAIDKNNRIYVGSYNELGYLASDSIGQMQYVSLLDRLPQAYHQCKQAWYTHVLDQSVYFMTPKYLFRYANDKFKVWETSTTFSRTLLHDQKLYVKQENLDLMVILDDSLQTISRGNVLKNNYVSTILPYDEKNALIGTLNNGFYLYNGSAMKPFPVSSLRLIIDSKCPGGLMLADSSIALHSYKNGVIVLNRNGELKSIINKSSGLFNSNIRSMYVGTQNGLWLATNNGISRIEAPSQFSYYDEQLGLEGKVEKIIRHQSWLFAATSQGIYWLSNKASPDIEFDKLQMTRTFEKVRGISTQCWNLVPFGSNLLAATRNGIYQFAQNRGNLIGFENQNVYSLVRSKNDSNRIFIGLSDGLASMYYDKINGWTDEGKLANFDERIRKFANDDDDVLWMCTSHNGVWRASFSDGKKIPGNIWNNATLTHVDTSYGLPSMDFNRVFTVHNRLIWGTEDGVYSYDKVNQRFIPQRQLGLPSPKNSWRIVRLSEGENNNLWMLLESSSFWELGIAVHQHINSYQWFNQPFYRFAATQINSIYAEPNNICWLGGAEGIIRYDASIPKYYSKDFTALIRRVLINGDSSLYAGAANISDGLSIYTKKHPMLDHNKSALRFEYAATSFDVSSANRFQYYLDGFDHGWSDWTSETTKDYTNIPEGSYQFKVRSRNVYQHTSSEDVFVFEVLPPWHRTVWAYLAYLLLFALFFMISVKWRSRRLEKKNVALEQLVARRTEEVRVQAEKLQEIDKLKSRFFANISHEFRTPLTLIIDPLNEMIAGTFKGDSGYYFNIMKKNAVRLLRLINQLLDLSRLESAGMKLQAKFGNIVPLMKGLVNSFTSIADRKNIDLQCIVQQDDISLCFDKDNVEKIITNLLSNAFKFTPDGGNISVTVSVMDDQQQSKKAKHESQAQMTDKVDFNHVQIIIADTGIGIPEDRLPYIFDRFYSIDNPHMSEQAGSGIGLALTKELVDLHHGEISVNNRKGGGTEFIIRLPLGKEYFCEDEISEESHSEVVPSPDLSATELHDIVEDEVQEELHSNEIQHTEESDSRNLILVVEDNTDVRNYIREYLSSEYDVVEAPNGKKGVEIAIEKIPDLIISDVMMPEMDGHELCRILKDNIHTNHIPIILLTAKAEDSDKIAGLKTGADDYLIKPFNSQELLTRIKNLIDVRHRLQEKYKMEFLLQPNEVAVESIDDAFVKKACEIVENNMDNPDFSVEIFAHKIAMSRGNLHRKLRAVVNQSASDFIRALRLKRAAQLLQQQTGNITEISFEVGFTSTAYFSKCFREQFGISPSEYVKKQ